MNLQPRTLTDAEYASLKKKLHQAHDKIIKVTLHETDAMRELMSKIIMPLLKGVKIDLDGLKLDTTTYLRRNLQAFFSDVVYLTTLIDETNGIREAVKTAILVEHKSEMPSELLLRLQAGDYINAIMRKNYNKETDSTIPVLTIIFNQFDKEWTPQPLRSLFPQLSLVISRFIPEFDYLVINLSNLSDEIMDSLDKFGTLKAALLAMRYVRNKKFLKQHFEEIFLFLQQHPEKTELRDQLITYLLGQSDLSVEDLEDLLNNIFSPVLKQEVMVSGNGFIAVAARDAYNKAKIELRDQVKAEVKAEVEAEAKAKAEIVVLNAKNMSVMYGWHAGVSVDQVSKTVNLPSDKVKQLFKAFEEVKTYYFSTKNNDMKALKKLSGLSDADLKSLLTLLQPNG
jgi:hypothetical protein